MKAAMKKGSVFEKKEPWIDCYGFHWDFTCLAEWQAQSAPARVAREQVVLE